MSLGIYFEIKDAELYGGEGTTGYAATIVEISIEGLQNANFEKYANSQLEAMASTTQHGRRRKMTSSGTCWRRTGIHTASWRRSSDIQKEPSSAGSWTLESRLGQFGAPPRKWTEEEVETLCSMVDAGYDFTLIAEKLNRTALATRGKFERLQNPEYNKRYNRGQNRDYEYQGIRSISGKGIMKDRKLMDGVEFQELQPATNQ